MKLDNQKIDYFAKVQSWFERTQRAHKKAYIIFRVDFRYEMIFLDKNSDRPKQEQSGEKSPEISEIDFGEFGSALKKMRNAVARAVHPDKHSGSPEMEEEFKKVQDAFEDGNANLIMSMARKYDIDVELKEEDISKMSDITARQLSYINNTKKTNEYRWMESNRNNQDRRKVWSNIGIDEVRFVEWLNDQGKSLSSIEEESVGRKSINHIK